MEGKKKDKGQWRRKTSKNEVEEKKKEVEEKAPEGAGAAPPSRGHQSSPPW